MLEKQGNLKKVAQKVTVKLTVPMSISVPEPQICTNIVQKRRFRAVTQPEPIPISQPQPEPTPKPRCHAAPFRVFKRLTV